MRGVPLGYHLSCIDCGNDEAFFSHLETGLRICVDCGSQRLELREDTDEYYDREYGD